jgi:6-phosphogluconolactonase
MSDTVTRGVYPAIMSMLAIAATNANCHDSTPIDAAKDASKDAVPDTMPAVPRYVVIGGSDGMIRVAPFDTSTGAVGNFVAYRAGTSPSFLALAPDRKHLFATDEVDNLVRSFSFDSSNGALTARNDVASGGTGPTHISIDATGKWVMAANYTDGRYAVFAIATDGQLANASDGSAIGANAHYIGTDPSNRFAYIPCLGANYIAQRMFDATTGTLRPLAAPNPAAIASQTGAGPRHMAFRSDGKFAYVVNEINSTITTYSVDNGNGGLTATGSISTLPAGFSGATTGAEIATTGNGRFVYSSNRGHDSIAGFASNPSSGALTSIGFTATNGATPRSFSIDASGTWLAVANQASKNFSLFKIGSDGSLVVTGSTIAMTAAPTFIGLF